MIVEARTGVDGFGFCCVMRIQLICRRLVNEISLAVRRRIKMKRIVKKTLITTALISLALIIVYILTNRPVICKKYELSILLDSDNSIILKEEEEEEMNCILQGETEGDVIRNNVKLPEEWEEGKIVTFAVHITMRNITVLPLDNINATIGEKTEDSYILFTYCDLETQRIKPLSKKEVCVMWFEMYCDEMDYNQIREYISKRTAVVNYTMPLLGTHSMEIPLKDVKIKKILDVDKDGYTVDILPEIKENEKPGDRHKE